MSYDLDPDKFSKDASNYYHSYVNTLSSFLLQQALGSLKLALQYAVENISLSWDLPPGLTVKMLSPEQPAIIRGQRLIIYAQLTGLMPVSPYPYSFF